MVLDVLSRENRYSKIVSMLPQAQKYELPSRIRNSNAFPKSKTRNQVVPQGQPPNPRSETVESSETRATRMTGRLV